MGLGSIFELASHFTSSGRRNIEYCARYLSYLESIHAALHELAARPRRRAPSRHLEPDPEEEEPLRLKRHKPLPLMDDDDWVIIEEDHNAEGKRPLNWDGGTAGRKKHK